MISCLGPAAWARPRCLEYYAVMHWRAVHICHWPKYMKAQLLHFLAIDSRDSRIIILFITSRKSGKAFCYAREHNCCNASPTIQKARPSKKKRNYCAEETSLRKAALWGGNLHILVISSTTQLQNV